MVRRTHFFTRLLLAGFYGYIYAIHADALSGRHEYVSHSVDLFCSYPQGILRISYDPCLRSPDFKRPLLYEISYIER